MRLGIGEDERHRIHTAIAQDPMAGSLIPGTGGARKLRFRRPGTGKRGGYRVVTYFAADDVPVFLLEIFAKGERVDLTKAERNELKRILGGVAESYRASVKAKVARLSEIA
jgi:hypothetical protein